MFREKEKNSTCTRQLRTVVTSTGLRGPHVHVQILALPLLVHGTPPVRHFLVSKRCRRNTQKRAGETQKSPSEIHRNTHPSRAGVSKLFQ